MSRSSTICILSAGAPKTGVRFCAEAYSTASDGSFEIEFATAPKIRERVAADMANADVIVAPAAAMEEFETNGSVVAGSSVALGSVSAGVAVRNGAQEPDLSSADSLRKALLAADMVVYNRASSGQYIETMVEKLGIAEAIAAKTVRTDTGAAAMEHLAADQSERPIGFGQITEIRLKEDLGIHLVGPLPVELGKKTNYRAALLSSATNAEGATGLLELFASNEGRRTLFETGIE